MKYWFLVLFILNSSLMNAQSARDSVMWVINHLFEAMRNADATQLTSCFTDSAILQTIQHAPFDTVKVRTSYVHNFAAFVSKEAKGNADEKIQFESIRVDGALASVWAPYSFYYKGKFSHCGVNAFQLVRLASGWKIQYLIDTRRKEHCSDR